MKTELTTIEEIEEMMAGLNSIMDAVERLDRDLRHPGLEDAASGLEDALGALVDVADSLENDVLDLGENEDESED